MRKSELKLKTMRGKLSIESSRLDAWLFSFGINQPGVLGPPISFPVCYCITPVHGWQ